VTASPERAVFVVTSTIRPSNLPLSYSPTRSCFNEDQRLEQTLYTIESIRRRAPGAKIVLVENSLADGERVGLDDAVDVFLSVADNERSVTLRDCPYKGLGELDMLRYGRRAARRFDYDIFFKLSGRYWLNTRFNIAAFPTQQFGFHPSGGTFSTRLYSVPRRLERWYAWQLWRARREVGRGAGIEAVIMRGVPNRLVVRLPQTGVSGYAAYNGDLIEE
jgi:hypothetical protein